MDIGMVGLGRMGANMTKRLLQGGHRVVVSDLSPDAVAAAAADGAVAATSLSELVSKLPPRRAIWLMVPSGAPVQSTIDQLAPMLSTGDVMVDGGNSNYHDSVARGEALQTQGIEFVDCGTSGGIWGLTEGFCLMAGGSADAFALIEPALKTLAPVDGLYQTREARGVNASKLVARWGACVARDDADLTRGHGDEPEYVHLRMCDPEHPAPLGWLMAAHTRDEIDKLLDPSGCNATELRRLFQALSPLRVGQVAKL